jgi:hypothetical protein
MKRLCVFCGARDGAEPAYLEAALAFGTLVAQRGLTLVTGGGALGLMGAVTDAALAAGGEVVGVIPTALVDREVAHARLTRRVVVRTMFERMQGMMDEADAFVSLPGGIGTLDELFEVWTWNQLGLFAKPSGLLNVADYWTPLVAMLDRIAEQRFMTREQRELLLVDTDAARLLERLAEWRPPRVLAGTRP